MMNRNMRWSWLAGGVVALSGRVCAAALTQEEVLRSINQNVDSTVDVRKAIPYLLVGAASLILFVLYNYRKQRKTVPRSLNNSARLTRELSRSIHLKPVELKQLKVLADEQDLAHPLTLLLCPSVLGKAMRSTNPKIDRRALQQVVQRLRQSLANR